MAIRCVDDTGAELRIDMTNGALHFSVTEKWMQTIVLEDVNVADLVEILNTYLITGDLREKGSFEEGGQ